MDQGCARAVFIEESALTPGLPADPKRAAGALSDITHDIVASVWRVVCLHGARDGRSKLPGGERAAVDNAVKKLEALGPDLPYPHSSDARGAPGLREPRPRGGRCAWRPLYQRAGAGFVIAAIAPDGQSDPRGFRRACNRALRRLAEVEEG